MKKKLLLMVLTLGMFCINVGAQTKKVTRGKSSEVTKTYNDVSVFDLKGRVKKCIWEEGSSMRYDLRPLTKVLTFNNSGMITNNDIQIKRDEKKRIYIIGDGRSEILYRYGDNGKIKGIIHGPKSDDLRSMALNTVVTFDYNSRGEIVKASDYSGGNTLGNNPTEVVVFKYTKFDKKGNWIEREYKGSEFDVFTMALEEVTFKEKRVIEYYP